MQSTQYTESFPNMSHSRERCVPFSGPQSSSRPLALRLCTLLWSAGDALHCRDDSHFKDESGSIVVNRLVCGRSKLPLYFSLPITLYGTSLLVHCQAAYGALVLTFLERGLLQSVSFVKYGLPQTYKKVVYGRFFPYTLHSSKWKLIFRYRLP